MGRVQFTTRLEPRGQAAAVVLDQAQVSAIGEEYARWVAEAKREETRQRRVVQALEMIRARKTRS